MGAVISREMTDATIRQLKNSRKAELDLMQRASSGIIKVSFMARCLAMEGASGHHAAPLPALLDIIPIS
jgi:hypothetical protein